ncbi:MAG: hypothetical protein OEY14_07890, partial [Myxococcales bacterium]|nr:hypothetical protein [Myxococcales bacterium]
MDSFPEAPAGLLEERALLKRVDSKFVASLAGMARVLRRLRPHTALLRAAGEPLARYRTLYFDSPELHFARAHLRGRRPRHK